MACSTDIVKCRKCRCSLFELKNIVDFHGNKILEKEKTERGFCITAGFYDSTCTVFYLTEDSTLWESWILDQINQSEWIKGKLICPKCNYRLGSFDFVGGSLCKCGKMPLPPIHITKSKVDCLIRDEIREIQELISNCPTNPDYNFPIMTATGVIQEPSTSDLNEVSSMAVSKNEVQETLRDADMKECNPKEKNSKRKNEMKVNQESSLLRTLLTCPVCLDIYLSPFICKPCGHIFCESCLRRIALPNPTRTFCPLCRQIIQCCEINIEHNKLIRANFLYENRLRMQNEDKSLLQTYPLPWVPLHQFRHVEHERSFFETALIIPRNFVNSFWLSIPTIGLLFLLHSVGFATFFLSYFGFSYIGSLWVSWVSPLWKFLWFAGSNLSVKESNQGQESIFPIVYAMFFAFLVTAMVWKKLRNSVL